jgi:hypothetical protein
MDNFKSKTLQRLEEKIRDSENDPLRQQILKNAKSFKTSWIELGRSLYAAWKDKLYKEWGYNNFDTYTAREIGIRKQTSMKLLRSYFFLEKEEPGYLRPGFADSTPASTLPGYEAIDVLRLAKNKKDLDTEDYANLKKEIFEKGKDARDVRRELTGLIRQRQELEPEEARNQRKITTVRRLVSILKSIKEEMRGSKLVSAAIIRQAESLISKLEDELR